MVFCRANPVEYFPNQANVEWLQRSQTTKDPWRGAWSYGPNPSGSATTPTASSPCWRSTKRSGRSTRPTPYPRQRSHLAAGQRLLGRLPEPRRLLGLLQGHRNRHRQHDLRRHQLADHRQRHGPPGRRQGRRQPDPVLRTRRRGKRPHRAGNGLAGRTSGWTEIPASRRRGVGLYYLYGVERVGRLTGRRFIGGHDWYREGADYLVRQQGNIDRRLLA